MKTIGFPMKDGCHVEGCNLGIEKINEIIKLDKIIEINPLEKDSDTVEKYNTVLAQEVDNTIKDGLIPLTIGGDHSLAIGSIAGSAANYNNLGVIWFDTHPDMNTIDTTTSFHIHGYPLAASMGLGEDRFTKLYQDKTKVKFENVVLFGINDIDDPEQEFINKYGVKAIYLKDIEEKGLDACLEDAVNYLKDKTDTIHLSFDIDCITTKECPGVNVPNRWNNGIKEEQAYKILNKFLNELNIVSMDIVEYNPLTDIDNKSLNIFINSINIAKEKFQK